MLLAAIALHHSLFALLGAMAAFSLMAQIRL